MDDIAFLFIPDEWHKSARGFFDSYERGTAPIPRCPFIDPHWDEAKIEAALLKGVTACHRDRSRSAHGV